MEETALNARGKNLQELATAAQRALELTVESAHETLRSMNEVLCNPIHWQQQQPPQPQQQQQQTQPQQTPSSTAEAAAGGQQQEAGSAVLDEARFRLKTSTANLRALITAIFNTPQMRDLEGDSVSGTTDKSDPAEVERLEQRVSELRQEVAQKNQIIKALIDELRQLILDISMWQSLSV